MRIISGVLKGRRIHPPKKLPVRPTTDRAKEALFNILVHQYNFETSSVLDLFSGTGNISYEFASRGVKDITAVDQNNQCIAFIKKTNEELGLSISIVKSAVMGFLERTLSSYTFIFADPPYTFSKEEYSVLVNTIFSKNMLEENGVLIIEHAEQINLSDIKNFSQARNYGGCVFSLFE